MTITPELTQKIKTAAMVAAPVFTEHKWQWKWDNGYFIPSVGDITTSLIQRIEGADSTTIMSSSGRLMVRFDHENNEGQIYLSLGYFDLVEVTT